MRNDLRKKVPAKGLGINKTLKQLENNMSTFRIQRTRKAPVSVTQKTRQNTWNAIFQSMGKGHWFLVTKPNYAKVSQAAATHIKGKYSLYKHPTRKDCHVFMIKEK